MNLVLSLIFAAIVALSQAVTAWLGYRFVLKHSPSDRERSSQQTTFLILGVIGIAATFGIAVLGIYEQVIPQWDYARLELLPNVPIIDSKATFVFKATANLQSVSFAMGRTTDDPASRTYNLINLIREGRESVPRVMLSMDDWTFDIDALGPYGKIAPDHRCQ